MLDLPEEMDNSGVRDLASPFSEVGGPLGVLSGRGTRTAAGLSSECSAGFLSLRLNGADHSWEVSAAVSAF
jgi:hypothetical protein